MVRDTSSEGKLMLGTTAYAELTIKNTKSIKADMAKPARVIIEFMDSTTTSKFGKKVYKHICKVHLEKLH